MRKFTCYFSITVMLIFLQNNLVASLSPNMQKSALFRFKQSLTISPPTNCSYLSYDLNDHFSPSHPKTMNWSMSSDYCTWEGVICEHKTGDVIGLDLSCSQLEGAILPNSTLFQLSHLHSLNLFGNDFSLSNQFPQEFGSFAAGLTHLNLSHTRLSGSVPSGIARLYKLVSLDLTDSYGVAKQLEDGVFKSLLQNLTLLRVLNLQQVNISSVLPMNISISLRVLNLRNTGLLGVLPQEVFHLPNLEVLVLSKNTLTATLPKVKWGSSATLQHLYLTSINIYGGIPNSVGFLESLVSLKLYNCNMSGPIPRSIGNLSQLTYLGLGGNNFNGSILTVLTNLTHLRNLSISHNNFTGPLPPGLFDLPSLEVLKMRNNRFTGQLHGSISRLVNLTLLEFSSNNFSGVLDLEMFSRLEHLQILELSRNRLSVTSAGVATLPPKLSHLSLSFCNMKEFPHFLRDAKSISHLDLSNNQIEGEIPHWIGLVVWSFNSYLNLSHNRLTGGLEQIPWNNIVFLDLHSNMLNGSLPTLICNSSSLKILNLSHNKLRGALPVCPLNLTYLRVFDLQMNNIYGNLPSTLSNSFYLTSINLHGNKLIGRIPSSFAELNNLETLDLGSNQINDTFPQCLEALPNLKVLVLKSNKFHGLINKASKIEHPFPSLRILDLSYNDFSGPLPAKYFKNFKAMMYGDESQIEPNYMGYRDYYSDSTGLVIKGVEIELVRILNVFTTIDVSSNKFEGEIAIYIGKLVSLRHLNLSHNHLTGHIPSSFGKLTVLESLDLSFNQLEGEIPRQLTSIYSLAWLNLSCNQLRGHIPEGSQFNTFENDSYVVNLGLCGHPLSKKCENDTGTQEKEDDEDDDYFFNGFTWEAVVIGYGCGVVPAFIIGYLMLLVGKPKWFLGIIARELGLKIRRMEIKWR